MSKIADKSFGMLRVEVVCTNVSTDESLFVAGLYLICLVWCPPGSCV